MVQKLGILILSVFVIGVVVITAIDTGKSTRYLTKKIDMSPVLDYKNTIILKGMVVHERPELLGIPFPGDFSEMIPARTRVIDLIQNGEKVINLVITSPGGVVSAGVFFIRIIKAAQEHGITVNCYVDKLAASMATVIFTECDNRYATFGSVIMWHSAAAGVMGRMNVERAENILSNLRNINKKLWVNTKKYFSAPFFKEHFEKETLIDVKTLEVKGKMYLRVINKLTIENVPKPPEEEPINIPANGE